MKHGQLPAYATLRERDRAIASVGASQVVGDGRSGGRPDEHTQEITRGRGDCHRVGCRVFAATCGTDK